MSQRTERQVLGWATAASIATSFATQALLVVSGPLLARMLGVNGRGQLAALLLWPGLIAQLGALGLPMAITYEIARGSHGAARARRVIASFGARQAALLTCIHLLVLLFVLHNAAPSIRIAGFITLLAVPASLANQYGLAIIQGRRRFFMFNALRLSPVIIYATGVLALFLLGSDQVLPVALLWTGGYLTIGAISLTTGLRMTCNSDTPVSRSDVGAMVRFGLRGFLGGILPIETLPLDQMVVALFLSKDTLGLYVVGLSLTNLPRFVAQSIGYVNYPTIASQREAKLATRSLWVFFWLTLAATLLVVVPLWLAAGFLVPFFFGGAFKGSVSVTRILLIGAVFAAARRSLGDGLRGSGHPAAATIGEIASWLWLVPSLAVLVPFFGMNGVALALAGSYAASLLTLAALAVRYRGLKLSSALAIAPRFAWRCLDLLSVRRV
jgi:O-antigen/teichoic acid export membrane protein